ncbi:MAG: V-type ATPase subunit [Clostridiales bacterium]|nr:V-type ATPase subunit [Clostridiales bacterium]
MNASTRIYDNTLALQLKSRMDGERLRRLVEAKTVEDGLKMLADYGFSYSPDGTIDGFIVAETNKLIEFVSESESERAARSLLAEFVYNNVKLAYKARFVEIGKDGYYDIEGLDVDAIKHGDYKDCDEIMTAALEALDSAGESKPQNIDRALTNAMYKTALSCPSLVIKKYFRAQIDMINILTAARMYRLKIFNENEFIPGGTIKLDELTEAASGKNFALIFGSTPYADMAERLEKSDFTALGAFERESDDYLFYMTDELAASMSSYKPFLNRYTSARIELKTIKAALVCIKTDSREAFYARRPDIYA